MNTPVLIGVVFVGVLLAFVTYKFPRLSGVLLWALVATVLSSAAIIVILPGGLRERTLWLAFFVPVIWVAFQFWCYWDTNHWRVVLSLLSLSIASAGIIYLAEPMA